MKQPDCPRCLESFESNDRFCKKCGLRKSRPFAQKRWWLFALLGDLLLVVSAAVLREVLLDRTGQQLDLATWIWLVFILLGISFLPLALFLNKICIIFWLRRHGETVEGEVVEHRKYRTRKGRTLLFAVVEFRPDIAQPVLCRVEHQNLVGVLPLQQKVPVRYDPHNPAGYAQVGAEWSGLIFDLVFCLFLACIPALIVVFMLLVNVSYS